MALKKKIKVTAHANTSSLTDIIFLLLLFFIMASSMVIPHALNLQLPGNSSNVNTTDNNPQYIVSISNEGLYFLNNRRIDINQLEEGLKKYKESKPNGKTSIVITPDANCPNEFVVEIMDLAFRLNIEAVMTKPNFSF